ncbi:MAG: hypothetical protein QM766_09100 [Burkholderiaceae bacterium]
MLQLEGSLDFPEAEAYRDDRSDTRFYVLPKVPTIKRADGKLAFKYVKYRSLKPLPNGDVGAALVFMDIELALTPQQEDGIRARLVAAVKARRGPNDSRPLGPEHIELAKIPVTQANVSVEILADSNALVQKVNHAGKPSMYGNNVVAVSAELNQSGAPIFEATMRSEGAGGIRVVYDLEFAARVPPITGTGTWHANKFYSFFQDVHYKERFWSEDDMSESISEMFRNSESRTVVIDPGSLPNTDPNVAKVLDTIRASLERQLDEAVKRNLLDAIPPESRDVSKIREQDFENIKRSVTVNKQSDVTISLRENQVTNVDIHPQANLPSITDLGFQWTDYAIDADTDDPFFRQLNVAIQVNADFQALPIFSVDVSIDYPPHTARHGVQTFSFRNADDIQKFTAFIENDSTEFQYSYIVNYKGESRTFQSAPKSHQGNDLKINVDDLGLWMVDVEVGDMNFDQVSRAVLSVSHPEVAPGVPPVSRFQIDKEHTRFSLKELLLQPAQPFDAEIKYFMSDGREYVRQLPGQKGQRFYVDDPFSANRTVQLRTRGDFERRIDTIFVDLAYDDERNGYKQTTSIALSKDKRFSDWNFPVIDERAGKLTYRAITTFKGGESTDSGQVPFEGTTLLLGEESATLTVKLIPDLIDWDKVKLVRVELHYSDGAGVDESESFTFRKGASEANWELALRDKTRKSYAWKIEFFNVDGSKTATASPEPVTDEDLIIEMPA